MSVCLRFPLPILSVLILSTGCATFGTSGRTDRVASRLTEMLRAGEKVSIVTSCEGTKTISDEHLRKMNINPDGYISGVCADVLGKVEAGYLQFFGRVPGFSLVERGRLESILNEQKLSVSGAIAASSQIRLGELTGATHMVAVTEMMYGRDSPNPVVAFLDGFNAGVSGDKPPVYIGESRTLRLIDLTTGRIVETQQIQF